MTHTIHHTLRQGDEIDVPVPCKIRSDPKRPRNISIETRERVEITLTRLRAVVKEKVK